MININKSSYNSIQSQIGAYGWDQTFFQAHQEAYHWLKQTRLIFDIRAHQVSSHDPELSQGIRYDIDKHPLVFSNGTWERVDSLRKTMRFDERTKSLLDLEGREWRYFPGKGLQPLGWKFNKSNPAHHLSPDEMGRLRVIGATYDSDEGKDCYVQVCSSQHFSSDKIPDHTAVRVIMRDGRVFSMGYEAPGLRKEVFGCLPFTFFNTIQGGVSNCDYDEFRSFKKRHVTTIPVTSQMAEKLLDDIQILTDKGVSRFNFAGPNCTTFTEVILKKIGVEVDFNIQLRNIFGIFLPKIHFPHPPLFVNRFIDVITYVPRRIIIVIRNIFFVACGMAMSSAPKIDDKLRKEIPEGWHRLVPFARRINSIKDLFSDEVGNGSWSPYVIKWQQKQPSTRTYTFDRSRPQFCIV